MKPLFLRISLTLVLTACGPAVAPSPTRIATVSTVPATSVPPMATIPPSPTVDPSMPEGATGNNDKGAWIKFVTENGKPVEYTWNAELNGWFTSHVLDSPDNLLGGIPLLEASDGYPAETPFYFCVQDGVSMAPYLGHQIANPDEWGRSLSGAIYNQLHDIRFGKSLSRRETADAYQNGTLDVPFTAAQGKEYRWNVKVGYKFYAISWDDANPSTHPEFYEQTGPKQFEDILYRWTVYTESDSTLVVRAAVKDPASLTDTEFLEWILNPTGLGY